MRRIQKDKKLGFGKFSKLTGGDLMKSAEGTRYLRWAVQAGIEVDSEISKYL